MQLQKVVCIAVYFLLSVCYVSAGETAAKYYFKMSDGKTYVGDVLPSDTTFFKVRQENGEIIDLPFEDVLETGEFTASGGVTANAALQPNDSGVSGGDKGAGFGTEFEFGLMYYHLDYKEDLPPPNKSEESGWLPGIYVGLKTVEPRKVYLNTFLELSSDDVSYDGSTQGGTPLKGNSSATFWRFQFNIGYTFPVRRNILLSPYTGYGYRYWERGLGGPSPYDEVYKWHYFPLGLSSHFILNEKWSIHPGLEARFMFNGSMEASFSDPGYNQLNFSLGNETGFKFDVPIKYNFSEFCSVTGTPWFSNSKIGESETQTLSYYGVPVGTYYEPSSETNQYGFNLIFSYRFK